MSLPYILLNKITTIIFKYNLKINNANTINKKEKTAAGRTKLLLILINTIKKYAKNNQITNIRNLEDINIYLTNLFSELTAKTKLKKRVLLKLNKTENSLSEQLKNKIFNYLK